MCQIRVPLRWGKAHSRWSLGEHVNDPTLRSYGEFSSDCQSQPLISAAPWLDPDYGKKCVYDILYWLC